MLIELLSMSNYGNYNIKVAQILGLETAVYLNELMNINEKAVRKKKIDDNIFIVDRQYIQSRTTIEPLRQEELETNLIKLGILEKTDKSNNINLNITALTSILAAPEEDLKGIAKIAKKTKNALKFIHQRDILVFADKFQLKRVIKNLIQNAISYGRPKTPIEISIGEIPNYIIIKVKDHGDGISKENIDRIFNKYYSAANKFRKIGTGLGLYLALQIVKAHNGDLTVESAEGEFTEFCIKIPINYERNTLQY